MSDPWDDFAGPAAVADPEPADAPWNDFGKDEEPWNEYAVPRGTPVEQDDRKPRLRSEAFEMLNDAGRLSPRLQRDVADESSGVVGGTMRAGKNALGAVAETFGEALSNPFTTTEAFSMNELFGEGTGGVVADDLKVAAEKGNGTLGNFVKYFEDNGVTDGKEMMSILKDSVRENTWDPTSDDTARVLSDGTLRVNPKFVALPDAEEGIKAIRSAPVDDATREREIERFKEARKNAAVAFDEKTRTYDEDYRKHAAAKAAEGVTDPEQVFYSWPGLDRNFIEKSWDVVRDTVAEAGRGTYRTFKGAAAGVAEAMGSEEDVARIGKDILESSKKSAFTGELAAARGEEGAITGTGKELGTTVLEMVPMFAGAGAGRLIAGGAEAGAARRILGSITSGTSVYGYAGAQGYASIMQTALQSAEAKAEEEGRELTDAEINSTVEKFQGAALANGFQTAVLAKLLGGGVEKAALEGLGAKAGQMTGRDLLAAYGEKGVRAAMVSLKPELKEFAKQAYGAAKEGFKDEALEEGLNQFIEGTITKLSGADADKTWDQIGQETFKGAWMGGVIGGGLPVATKVLAQRDPTLVTAQQMAARSEEAAPDSAGAAADAITEAENGTEPTTDDRAIPSGIADLPMGESPTTELLPSSGDPTALPEPSAPVASPAAAEAVAETPGLAGEPAIPLTNETAPPDDTGLPGPGAGVTSDAAPETGSPEVLAERADGNPVGDSGVPVEPVKFTTSKGSTYEVGEGGATTRNKKFRPEHGEAEQGPMPKSDRTIYFERSNLEAMAPPSNVEWRVFDHGDGTASLLTWNGEKWGVAPSQKRVSYTTEPEVGKYPMELWRKDETGGYKAMHPGNSITEVKKTPKTEQVAPGVSQPAYTKQRLQETFNLSPEQADATDALVQAMGLDTSKILLTRGGVPGAGLATAPVASVESASGAGSEVQPEALPPAPPAPQVKLKAVATATLSDADKQSAAVELGFDSWTLDALDAFTKRMADWMVTAKDASAKLVEMFQRVWDASRVPAILAAVSLSLSPDVANYQPPVAVTKVVEQTAAAIPVAPAPVAPVETPVVATASPAPVTLPVTATVPEAPAPVVDFNGEEASENVRVMADWVIRNKDNGGKAFSVADKMTGEIFFFSGNGTLVEKSPALFGTSSGDVLTTEQRSQTIEQSRKDKSAQITPAGRFESRTRDDNDGYGRSLVFLDQETSVLAIHRVYLGRPAEDRPGRLKSASPLDNRISLGCINLPVKTMELAADLFTDGGTIYILPETEAGKELFPGFGGVRVPDKSPRKRQGRKPLFQDPRTQGIKGSFEVLETGEMLLRGLTNPDVSTALHELSHVARRTLFDRNAPVAGLTTDDIDLAETWAHNGRPTEDGTWTTAAEEKFARGFEQYLRDGKAPNPQLAGIFAKVSDWLKGIYQSLKGSPLDLKISPAMREVFDRLVTRNALPDAVSAPPPIVETPSGTVPPEAERAPAPEEPLVSENGEVPPPPVEPASSIPIGVPEDVTALKHAVSDTDRARLGLPLRTSAPPTTDQAAWDAAVDASVADPDAGSQLLSKLTSEGPRALTKQEHALLLHEKLRRDQAFERTTKFLNDLPGNAPLDVRSDASNQMQKALSELETLLTYADAAGSASGLSLQARKMLVAQDFSLSGVLARMLGAKNKFATTKQALTPAEVQEAAKISEKLRQAQERVDSLTSENAEQARIIEELTKDVERAQERAGNRDPKKKSKIRKALASRAEAAKARLKGKGFLAQADNAQQPDPSVIVDAAAIAADWLVDKALTPADFLTRALKEFGTWVSDHIDAIRKQADQIYHETADSVSGKKVATPEEVMAGVDGKGPLDRATVWQLARAFVVSGVRGNNVLTSVHETLSPTYPDLTREKVAELFTDYGTVSYPSAGKTAGELNKIRNLERTALKMADVLAKRLPKRTGFQRGEQDVEVRKAEKEFREEYRKLEEELRAAGVEIESDEQKLKTAQGALKRRMENEIEELQLAMDAKTPRVKGSAGIELDEDGKALQKKLDTVRKAYAEAFPAEVDKLQDAKDSASASIDRYLRMLVRGDVALPKKDGVTADAELKELQALRDTFAKQVRLARNPKPTEAETLETARQKAIQSAEETLAGIERKIAGGDLSKVVKGESPFASDLVGLREKIATARKTLTEMRKAAEPKRDPEEARREALDRYLDRQIAEEERAIAEGDLERTKAAPAPDSPGTAERRAKLTELRQIRRDLYEAAHPGETALIQAKMAAEKSIQHYRDILDGKLDSAKTPVSPDEELKAAWDVREALRDEVAEMRRALPISPEAEAKQLVNALRIAQANLLRLERKLLDGDLSVPAKKVTSASTNPHVLAVRARVKELNNELSRLRRDAKVGPYSEVARVKRTLGSIEKRKAELERRNRENDFSTKTKPLPVNTAETRAASYAFAKVQAEYHERLVDHTLTNATFSKKLGYRVRSTSNLMKVLTLGGDFGVLFRNLGGATTNTIAADLKMLLPGKAGAAARASESQVKQLLREGFRSFTDKTYETDLYERIIHRPNAGYDAAFGMKYATPFEVGRLSTEDIPAASLIDSIPWWVWPAIAGAKIGLIATNPLLAAAVGLSGAKIGLMLGFSVGQKPLLQALDRAQRAMTNQARAMLIDGLIYSSPGDVVSAEDGKAFGTAVMVATGRGQAKSLESMMPAIQTVALAGRFYLSRIQALTLYPLWSGPMSSNARKQIAGFYGKSVTGRASIYLLLALAFGKADDDDPEDTGIVLDPWSKDFGKVRVSKDVMVDVMSGLNQWGHAMYRTLRGGQRDKESGKIKVYTPQESGEDVTRFLAGRRSLTFGYLYDTFVKKEYYGGKPRTLATALDEATTAIILNDTVQVFEDAGPVRGALVMGLMLSGGGVNVGSYEKEKAKWAELRGIAEEERQAREDRLNE